jgi:acetyltransferase-like isoleucine patch superfamily enzyme
MIIIIKKILTSLFTYISIRNIGGYKSKPKVNFYSRFTKNTFMGFNCHFNGMIIRGEGRVTIGDNFHSGRECLMINSYHKYDNGNAIPYDRDVNINKNIEIEDNVWLGDRVLILGGVKIGEGAIIQAGSNVVTDIPKYAIAGGNPANIFKYRDVDSYLKLKSKGEIC